MFIEDPILRVFVCADDTALTKRSYNKFNKDFKKQSISSSDESSSSLSLEDLDDSSDDEMDCS
jgi:hypothetical protein